MSVIVMGEVWLLDLPTSTKMILLALADHSNDDGTHAYPGVRRLAWKTGLSVPSTKRILRDLRDSGLIEAVAWLDGGRGHATKYTIHVVKGISLTPFEPVKGITSDRKGYQEQPERVSSEAVKGITSDPPTISNHPEPSVTAPGRKRDPIWDALTVIYGEPETRSERGRRNTAAKELRDIDVTPDEIQRRAAEYRRRWPDIEFTPTGLAGNWTLLSAPPGSGRCPVCNDQGALPVCQCGRSIDVA